MDITVFENSVRNYLLTKYGVVYTSGINLTQVPDGDLNIYTCKLSLNNKDKPLAITGQYPDLDSFLLNVYKEIDSRRFYTSEYFTLRNMEQLSNNSPIIMNTPETPCISTTDTVGDIYLRVLEKINPTLKSLQDQINLLSATVDNLSTIVNNQGGTSSTEGTVSLDELDEIFEIGSSVSVNITGEIVQNNETEITSAIIDYVTGYITLPNSFGSINITDINVTSDRIYTAEISFKRVNIDKVVYSNSVSVKFVYPFFYGLSDSVLLNTDMYTSLTKDISDLGDKFYTLNGLDKYIYILIPDSYPSPRAIEQNGINVKYAFVMSTQSVNSSGLNSNWNTNYKVFRTIDKTSVVNQEFNIIF